MLSSSTNVDGKYSVKYIPSCHCEVAKGTRGNL